MKCLAAILCLALASCVPKAIVVEPIAPAVATARADVRAAGEASKRVHSGVEDIAKQVKDVSMGINDALSHADSMRATSAEPDAWQKQWDMLTEVRTRNMFAEAAADGTMKHSTAAQALQRTADEGMGNLEASAKNQDKGVEKIKIHMAKQSDNAALGKGVKTMIWAGAILAFLLLVLLAVAKFTKKTIIP
jgi:hypothetical protein